MTRITRSLVESAAVLATGFAVIGLLMFAFAHNAEARDKDKAALTMPKLEIAINDNGRVLVRGAEITAITDTRITARTDWGASALAWTVRTDADTAVLRADGSSTRFADLSVGDTISFSGSLDAHAGTFTVDADAVRDWSLPGDARMKDRIDAHAKLKAEARADWNSWFKRMPVFSWFGERGDR